MRGRTGQRFGANYVIDVLVGSQDERITHFGHDQLSTHGIGTELDRNGWRAVVRQLMARGVLSGEDTLQLRKDPMRAPGSDRKRKGGAAKTALIVVEDAQADPGVTERFERLRELRLRFSREAGVPPHVVFHDKTSAAMAALCPRNEAELMEISGVGQSKLEKWGAVFLEALSADGDPA